jgi:hypothetical protein
MSRAQTWYLHVTFALVTITGAGFAWMKYFVVTDNPFALANHAWQPHMLKLHILFAPLLVFGLGLIFSSHIASNARSGRGERRGRSGMTAIVAAVPMIASGYLLQVFTSESLLRATAISHWVTTGLFIAMYLGHQFVAIRRMRGAEPRSVPQRGAPGYRARRVSERVTRPEALTYDFEARIDTRPERTEPRAVGSRQRSE